MKFELTAIRIINYFSVRIRQEEQAYLQKILLKIAAINGQNIISLHN